MFRLEIKPNQGAGAGRLCGLKLCGDFSHVLVVFDEKQCEAGH